MENKKLYNIDDEIELEPIEIKFNDTDTEEAEDYIERYGHLNWWYILHWDISEGKQLNDYDFVTYEEALAQFNQEEQINEYDRIELMFAPEDIDGERSLDNMVIMHRGAEEMNESGRASKGMSVEDIAKKHGVSVKQIEDQIKKGIKVEQEHTTSMVSAKRTAMDHLVEIPDYYDRLIAMEKEAKLSESELNEKKKKPSVKGRDYNAKAMWGRVKAQTFKAKKGKGSSSRKAKHRKAYESLLTEGTSNFSTMDYLPLLIWVGYEEAYEECSFLARKELQNELTEEQIEEMGEDGFDSLVMEKAEDLMSEYEYCILDESEQEDLEGDIGSFNYENTDDDDFMEVKIVPGYYSAYQMFCDDSQFQDMKGEIPDKTIAFFYEMKEKYGLTEMAVSGRFSNGGATYSKSTGLVEIGDEDDKDLEEDYLPPSEDLVKKFSDLMNQLGYDVESIRRYDTEGPFASVHFQIKSKENKFTQDNFAEEFERMSDAVTEFDKQRKNRITYSFGLTRDGYSTAGLDLRPEWVDPSEMVEIDEEKKLEEAAIEKETMDAFLARVKKLTGNQDIKIIEAISPLTEAKADIDRFIAWGSKELYDRFLKLKQRLKSPDNDIMYWTSSKNPHKPEELEAKLTELEATKTKSQVDAEAKEGAEVVAKNDVFTVYLIKSFAASQKYGKNAEWCISGSKRWVQGDMQPENYWDRYYKDGVKFYFFLKNDGSAKYAFAMYPNGTRQVFDARDRSMNRTEVNKQLAGAPYVAGVFTPQGHRKKTNMPHLKNARQLGYTFTGIEDYVVDGDLAIEFRRKTRGTAVVPQEIKGLEDLCFAGKSELTEVVIHKDVTYIGVFAFAGCTSLTIKCEAKSKPSGWEEEWNPSDCKVVWGFNASEDEEDDIQDVNNIAHI